MNFEKIPGRRNGKSIERDAFRFMEAKLDYGKGAGTKRKLIKAELENKMQDDAYRAAFNDALMNVDTDIIMRRIERRKELENAAKTAKRTYRTARRGINFYSRNKDWIDFLSDFFFRSKR